jgi:Penicillin amidase
MVTSFTGGCPDDRSILTYSESENPNSPYFADQTRMFSKKEWVDPPFCASELTDNPSLSTQVINGGPEPRGAVPGSAPVASKRSTCRTKKRSTRCHGKRHR